ncbi:MAG: hypothetical protein ACTSYI_03345 [Promethearchaeota archaeon]
MQNRQHSKAFYNFGTAFLFFPLPWLIIILRIINSFLPNKMEFLDSYIITFFDFVIIISIFVQTWEFAKTKNNKHLMMSAICFFLSYGGLVIVEFLLDFNYCFIIWGVSFLFYCLFFVEFEYWAISLYRDDPEPEFEKLKISAGNLKKSTIFCLSGIGYPVHFYFSWKTGEELKKAFPKSKKIFKSLGTKKTSNRNEGKSKNAFVFNETVKDTNQVLKPNLDSPIITGQRSKTSRTTFYNFEVKTAPLPQVNNTPLDRSPNILQKETINKAPKEATNVFQEEKTIESPKKAISIHPIENINLSKGENVNFCSNCGESLQNNRFLFCENCGATINIKKELDKKYV